MIRYLLPIILLAAFLRLIALPTLPPGLNFDEAGNGVAALDILQGQPRLWWSIGGGKEPLWPTLLSLSIGILGNAPLTLRLPAAFVGILTVAAVYPLVRVLFPTPQGRWLALLTVIGVACSAWHLHFSRLGFRAILLPLFSTLAFYFFFVGIRQNTRKSSVDDAIASVETDFDKLSLRKHEAEAVVLREGSPFGLQAIYPFSLSLSNASRIGIALSAMFTALAMYSYLAARLLPLVPLLFLLIDWLKYRQHARRNTQHAITYSLTLALCLTPLIGYFSYHPTELLARTGTVSIFNEADPLGAAIETLRLTLGTFVGLTGDANPLVNLPHQPAIPLMLAPFLVIGVVRGLGGGQTFLLIWWLIMLLPALLAPEGAPHHLRLLGSLIPTYALIAVGLMTVVDWFDALTRHRSLSLSKGTRWFDTLAKRSAIILALIILQLPTTYFTRWPDAVDFTLPFDLYAVRLAEQIEAAPSDTRYVIPMDIRAAAEARHYTLDYLLADKRHRYHYLPVDERNAEQTLAEAAHPAETLRVVRWTQDKHHAADEKEIVTFLLTTQAEKIAHERYPIYEVETFAIPTDFSSQLPPISQTLSLDFDGLIRLDAAYLPSTLDSAAAWLPVALTLAPLASMDVDYKASVRLISPTGERLTQKDRTLRHNFHQGTSLWPPETVNEYYLLPIPEDAPSGEYHVTLVLYHPDTQAPLIANGTAEVNLGAVTRP